MASIAKSVEQEKFERCLANATESERDLQESTELLQHLTAAVDQFSTNISQMVQALLADLNGLGTEQVSKWIMFERNQNVDYVVRL